MDASAMTQDALISMLKAASPSELEALSEHIRNNHTDDEKQKLLSALLTLLYRAWRDPAEQSQRFNAAQALGLHVLPVHFYSPIPNTAQLPAELWHPRETPGIDWRESSQLDLLAKLANWSPEIAALLAAEKADSDPRRFRFGNDTFALTDAAVLYAMLREFKPARMIEVGCGWSSLIAAEACRKQQTQLIHIEPYPPPLLADHPLLANNRFIAKPVQEVELALFESLRENDILFIDSTHVSRIGSDVNHLYLNVLPRLAPGVFIHIHDIFLPGEYPKDWIEKKRYFWNEQYLVHALIMFTSRFKILLANAFLRERHSSALRNTFPALSRQNGGSLWIRVSHTVG